MSRSGTGARRLVLFVCRHGGAKSVLAAATLERLASTTGIAVDVVAAGVEPDLAVAPAVAGFLGRDTPWSTGAPHRLTDRDASRAWRIVTFDLDPSELPAAARNVERWDGLPPAGADPARTSRALEPGIRCLLDDLAAAQPSEA